MAGTPDPRRSSGSMQPAAVLVVAAAFLAGAAAAPGGACPRTQPVLTSACGNLCYAGRPCIVYDDGTTCTQGQFGECHLGSAATSNCAVECLKNGKDDFVDKGFKDFTNYNFLLPFGAWKSEKEKNWDADDLVEAKTTITQNLTNQYPSKSNDILKAIDPLEFLQSTKNVAICGGTTSDGLKGRVSQVNLAPSLLYTQSQLDSVLLANLDIEQLKASSLPPQLVNLTLSNCLLNTFPDDLLLMTKLKRLNLAKNYFSSFPAKYSLKSVTFLNASKNNLVSFEAYFPSVVTLDLSGNTLDKIPDTIFNMTSLQELYLGQNSFSNLKVTPDQFQFLSKIPSLYIDNWNSAKCPSSAMKTLGDAAICVQEASTGSRASASSSNSSSNNKGLIGGIIGGVVGALVIAIVFIVYWRRSQSSKGKAYEVTRTGGSTKSGQATGDAASLWADRELLSYQVNVDDIEDIRKIGHGAYGVVWLARYRGSRDIASKRIKRDEVTASNTRNFIAEIKLVAKLDHPRIVEFIGVAWTVESDLQALFEYMVNGDLRTYLESPASQRHWSNLKVQIATDIVDALVYVHSFTPPLVHRDMKSRNVLLDIDMRAKVSDFGVARYRSDQATMTSGVGTGRWLAPEVVGGSQDYDQSSDVYAFGVILSELDTHKIPYEDLKGSGGYRLADVAILQMVASGDLAPSFTPTCPPSILDIAKRCLSFDPKQRPTAVEAAYILRTIQKNNDFYVV